MTDLKPEPAAVRNARRDVASARQAMLATLSELKDRLQPRTLASEAWAKAKDKGADLAEDAVDAVKARPVAVGGALAEFAMFLARDPIKDGVRNLYGAMTSSKEHKPKPARKPKPAPASAKARVAKPRVAKPRPRAKTEK